MLLSTQEEFFFFFFLKRQFAVCDLIYMIEVGFQSHTDAEIVLSASCHV